MGWAKEARAVVVLMAVIYDQYILVKNNNLDVGLNVHDNTPPIRINHRVLSFNDIGVFVEISLQYRRFS